MKTRIISRAQFRTRSEWRKCSFHPIRTESEIHSFRTKYRRVRTYRAESESANFNKRYRPDEPYRAKSEIRKFSIKN